MRKRLPRALPASSEQQGLPLTAGRSIVCRRCHGSASPPPSPPLLPSTAQEEKTPLRKLRRALGAKGNQVRWKSCLSLLFLSHRASSGPFLLPVLCVNFCQLSIVTKGSEGAFIFRMTIRFRGSSGFCERIIGEPPGFSLESGALSFEDCVFV